MLGFVPDVVKLAGINSYGGYAKQISPPPVPATADKRERTDQLMISHHPLSLMGEMYRSICTAIMFSKAENPPRSILVSSSQPNEGKTVTAINIATIMAQSGGPVLLVDADLHGGRCHKLLGLPNGNGLSNILAGTELEEAIRLIRKTKVPNLYLLSRGTLPPNPAALLGSDKMRRTLDRLAAEFRFIVVDSPPLLPVSDTVLIATLVDGVILVAKGQEVPGDLVRRARDRLDYVNAKILGVVLNGVDLTGAEYAQYRQVYHSHYTNYIHDGGDKPGNMPPPLVKQNGRVMPPEFLESVTSKLAELVGAMAPVIVSQKIKDLGESPDAFPQGRIEELIDLVAHEILDTGSKATFRAQFANWANGAEAS
jgi:capsular exopolysaccharide synthesis family protein